MIKWNHILIVILLAGGGWLVFEMDRLDEEYNRLLGEGVHELKIIGHMSYNSNRRHNLFYSMMRERNPALFKKQVEEWQELKKVNTSYFDTIMSLNLDIDSHLELITKTQEERSRYNEFCEQQLEFHIANLNSKPEIDFERFDQLFENYQEKINELFLTKHRVMKSSSDNLAVKVESRIRNILLFVFSPLIVGLCMVAFAFVAFRFFYLKGKAYY